MPGILASLLSDLDIAVFERDTQGTFTAISKTPKWLKEIWPEAEKEQSGLAPGAAFLFLDDFLERVESFWHTPSDRQISSGVWTETAPDGTDHLLEAVAIFIEDRPLLLLRVPALQHTWPIYQQAREQRLEYEQLIDEINKREVLLHCIVHDLSNPLAGIKGTLSLLESEEMDAADRNELLRIGLRQATKMQRLIQDILTTFASEVKPIVPTLIGADIAPNLMLSAREVAASLEATATLKGLTIQVLPAEDSDSVKVIGETERLERVLFNLLTNAIRHSSPGQTIAIRIENEDDFVHVYIEDEGEGVPDDMVDSLFDRFSQGSHHNGQIGLGLYFCRITIENWGGAIGYQPREGNGASFWFKLPKPVSHEQLMLLQKAS